jgi:hypothetical protein
MTYYRRQTNCDELKVTLKNAKHYEHPSARLNLAPLVQEVGRCIAFLMLIYFVELEYGLFIATTLELNI